VRRSDRSASHESSLRRFRRWRDRVRDPALTVMLIAQVSLVVVIAPFGASGYGGLERDAAFELFRLLIGFLTAIISRGRFVTAVAIVAVALMISGNALSFSALSSIQLTHFGTIIGSVIISLVVGRAVLAPGPITAHRVLGAIVLYLNFGIIAAAVYRVITDFDSAAFGGIAPAATPAQITNILVYFSFTTLTTTGYGDIFPVNAFARGIANLEGIIGQLYPATLLARFVTLELESRRR